MVKEWLRGLNEFSGWLCVHSRTGAIVKWPTLQAYYGKIILLAKQESVTTVRSFSMETEMKWLFHDYYVSP